MTNFITRTAERRFKNDLEDGISAQIQSTIRNAILRGVYFIALPLTAQYIADATLLTKLGFAVDIQPPGKAFPIVISWHFSLPGTYAYDHALNCAIKSEHACFPDFKPNSVERLIRQAYAERKPILEIPNCPVFIKLELIQKGYIFENVLKRSHTIDSNSFVTDIIIHLPCTKLTTQPSALPVASEPQTEM